jgi:hypothetical protein
MMMIPHHKSAVVGEEELSHGKKFVSVTVSENYGRSNKRNQRILKESAFKIEIILTDKIVI